MKTPGAWLLLALAASFATGASAQTASCLRVGEEAQIAMINRTDQAIVCGMSCEITDKVIPKRSFFCNNVVIKPGQTGLCLNVGIPGTPGAFNITCSTQ